MIRETREGSEAAAQALFCHYWDRLLNVSKRKLAGLRFPVVDEEDVAITAFHSFIRRLRNDEYPQLADRDQAWRLLVTIAVRKALNYFRHERRIRRNPQPHRDEERNDWLPLDAVDSSFQPEVELMISDSIEYLLNQLEDDELRQIAMYKLAGKSNRQIAESLQRSVATVERRLNLIRARWQHEVV